MSHSNSGNPLKYSVILILLGFCGLMLSYNDNLAYGLYVPLSAQELLENSDIILVGNITSVTAVELEETKSNSGDKYEQNSSLALNEYTIDVEEFLKNPQDLDTITVREPTVSAGGQGPTGEFAVGERVLLYIKNFDDINEYFPESFKIPKQCGGQESLTQKRLPGAFEFFTVQDGIESEYEGGIDFTPNRPVKFVYNKDVGSLSGKEFDMFVSISKRTLQNNWEVVFQKDIHTESKPCEWIASAEWDFTPEEGDYSMFVGIKKDDKISDTYDSSFSAKSNIVTHDFMSPLEQYKSGIAFNEIKCNNDLLLIAKSSNGFPVCVTPATKIKLIERGWAKPV